jgi:homoserine O-succinyltransferase
VSAVPPSIGRREEAAAAGAVTRPSIGEQAEVVIGLVNNMPDSGLVSTERQFSSLLAETGLAVELRFFAVPGVPRGDAARSHVAERYRSTEELVAGEVDGLIVTGTEPRAARVEDEPFWDGIVALIEWAEKNTLSSVWSCLAAQAAVQHLDGIRRRKFDAKLSGVFESQKQSPHALTAGMPSRWRVPFSRHNDIPADLLGECGYQTLWQSRAGGADVFCKPRGSLFVFFQHHPEYDHGALGREYRRDVERFLRGASGHYPGMPEGYFDHATKAALLEFQARAVAAQSVELLADFPTIGRLAHSEWRGPAVKTFANWLSLINASRPSWRRQPSDVRSDADVAALL